MFILSIRSIKKPKILASPSQLYRYLQYNQGQSPEPKIREYFYYIDHEGMVSLKTMNIYLNYQNIFCSSFSTMRK